MKWVLKVAVEDQVLNVGQVGLKEPPEVSLRLAQRSRGWTHLCSCRSSKINLKKNFIFFVAADVSAQ